MSKMTKLEQEARERYEEAVGKLDAQDSKIQALPEDASSEERSFHAELFETLQEDVTRAKETWERQTALRKAREVIALPHEEDEDDDGEAAKRIRVMSEPPTYRADAPHSFFADMYYSQKGDAQARERLERHKKETRDVSTADPGAGVFLPPQYIASLWAELPRESRPFADILPSMPLPDGGMSITIPRLTTGASVAVQQTEADAPSETDVDGTLLTVNVRTIAGQQDMSVQALERTQPGMDAIVFQDLRNAYDSYLDTQLLSGTGANAQHLGIRAVGSINTVTYTDATPTAAEFVPQVYNAIQQIADGRKMRADAIIMHPRRAAWLASNLSSTFPLFQLGVLNQAAGSQQAGFVDNFAGLRVVLDSNIGTTYGTGTDEDEVYVVRSSDLILMEGPLRARVLEQTLAGTLQVKLQVFSYSAFISGRQPESICAISGTGLANPWS